MCLWRILGITWEKTQIWCNPSIVGPSTPSWCNPSFVGPSTPSWCNPSFVGPVMLSAWKIITSWRSCSTANYLRVSAPKKARKSATKTHWRSPRNISVSPQMACNIWPRIETSKVKLSNVERKSVKLEEMQQPSCTGNLEKALPHQPLLPPFLDFTAQDSSVHRLVSLAICALKDAFLNRKVDQRVLIDYDGQSRRSIYLSIYLSKCFSFSLFTRTHCHPPHSLKKTKHDPCIQNSVMTETCLMYKLVS